MPKDHYDDDERGSAEPKKRFREYECPECNADNPMADGIYEGDEVHCFYCGIPLIATVRDGKLKMKTV
jgi:DNA-directed RNA polymerase subunit RPC12/RpoP